MNDSMIPENNAVDKHSSNPFIRYRSLENVHVFLWLIKDFAWISGFQFLGMFMAVPTIILAVYITYLSRQVNASDFVHNIAVSCWIVANVVWMTGEFYFNDGVRHWAIPFFVLGIVTLLVFYGYKWLKRNP